VLDQASFAGLSPLLRRAVANASNHGVTISLGDLARTRQPSTHRRRVADVQNFSSPADLKSEVRDVCEVAGHAMELAPQQAP
jgi:hypothetical protein